MNSKEKILQDLETLGFYFENQVIKALMVFCEVHNYHIFYFQDEKNHEIDCIIESDNGNWVAIEIKLGSTKGINDSIKQLNSIDKLIIPKPPLNEKPLFKMIIVGWALAPYQRKEDGIIIMPFCCLDLFS